MKIKANNMPLADMLRFLLSGHKLRFELEWDEELTKEERGRIHLYYAFGIEQIGSRDDKRSHILTAIDKLERHETLNDFHIDYLQIKDNFLYISFGDHIESLWGLILETLNVTNLKYFYFDTSDESFNSEEISKISEKYMQLESEAEHQEEKLVNIRKKKNSLTKEVINIARKLRITK